MHPYIPHLLEDIKAAHREQRPVYIDIPRRIEAIIENFDRVLKEPGHSFGYYCGLAIENFPPPEQLLKKEMKLVSAAFKKMMLSWNVKCHLPKTLPPDRIYSLLIKILERRFDPGLECSVMFAYCSLNPQTCELKEYCSCLIRELTMPIEK